MKKIQAELDGVAAKTIGMKRRIETAQREKAKSEKHKTVLQKKIQDTEKCVSIQFNLCFVVSVSLSPLAQSFGLILEGEGEG